MFLKDQIVIKWDLSKECKVGLTPKNVIQHSNRLKMKNLMTI